MPKQWSYRGTEDIEPTGPSLRAAPLWFGLRLLPFLLLLGLFALQLWIHATRTSATSDEPVHILGGYRYWECGEFVVNPQHPPLLKLLAALPLRSRRFIEPDWPCGTRNPSWQEIEYAAVRFVAQNGTDPVLIPARLAAASMSLLLAVLVCAAAWEMFGWAEALVALVILIFEPTVIAHGSLVTTDMALTTTMVWAVYALYRYGKRPRAVRPPAGGSPRPLPSRTPEASGGRVGSLRPAVAIDLPTCWYQQSDKWASGFRLIECGLAVGAMLAAKHSGILMLPVLFILTLADALLVWSGAPESRPSLVRRALRVGLAYAVVLLVALGVVWGTHHFRYYALAGATHEALPFAELFNSNANGTPSVPQTFLELLHRARVFPESYTFGLAYRAVSSVRPMYLLGKVYPTGRWFYFPAAFAIKSSIALLILLPLSLLTRELYRTHMRALLFLLLPSLAYFIIGIISGLDIGVRHILPAYPFFIVVAAAGACHWGRRHRWVLAGLGLLLVYHGVIAARTAPSYIGFANDLWGGTRNTYRLLNDSNADWGQNLKLVEKYLDTHDVHDCWFAAFGMADLVRPYKTCRKLPAFGWAATERLVDLVPPVIEGTVLISSWELPPWGGQEYASLAATPPVDVIGGSILVFRGRFEVPLAAALSYASRADQLFGWQRYADALRDARQAVELGPDDPRTHWELAAALARNGLMDDARQETAIAKRLAHAGPASFAASMGG